MKIILVAVERELADAWQRLKIFIDIKKGVIDLSEFTTKTKELFRN